MDEAARQQEYERAARYRDMLSTVAQLQEKQRMAAAEGDDQDVFGYHYENDMLAVNVFHLRGGKILDRREFFLGGVAGDYHAERSRRNNRNRWSCLGSELSSLSGSRDEICGRALVYLELLSTTRKTRAA